MPEVPSAITSIISTLERLGTPYVVGGSFASSAWGVPRQTNDLDIALILDPSNVATLCAALDPDFFIDRQEVAIALDSLDPYRSFQLLHKSEHFKVDAFLPLPTPYFEAELARRERIELTPGVEAWCLSPECTVIRKLNWFELGNRVSDRQWNDIVSVLQAQHGFLDEAFLNEWTAHFSTRELLDEARSQIIKPT